MVVLWMVGIYFVIIILIFYCPMKFISWGGKGEREEQAGVGE